MRPNSNAHNGPIAESPDESLNHQSSIINEQAQRGPVDAELGHGPLVLRGHARSASASGTAASDRRKLDEHAHVARVVKRGGDGARAGRPVPDGLPCPASLRDVDGQLPREARR